MMPAYFRQKLFNHMSQEHGLTLTESEMIEIEIICRDGWQPKANPMTPHTPTKPVLTMEQLLRSAELLEIIVRPGDHDFQPAMEEAQRLFGYNTAFVRTKRGKRGLRERNPPRKH